MAFAGHTVRQVPPAYFCLQIKTNATESYGLCGFLGDYMNTHRNNIILRLVRNSDAEALSQIYRPYVENTAVSFEYTAPDAKEFENRIIQKSREYPYIVAEYGGEIAGYCYASQFLPRPAYKHSVETTLYIKKELHGRGIGRTLYNALERLLKLQNVLSLNACIAYADLPDETLNNDSMTFHSKMGYRYVGRFNASGYKFARFYDMIWMEKLISHPVEPFGEFVVFSEVLTEAEQILSEINGFNNKTVN